MISKERVETVGDVFAVGDELKAVVINAFNEREVQLSTKALELVPGQMKTDKQAVFANAAEGLAKYLLSKNEIMEQRRQALTQLK
ncbi:30S ribosomal protein S1, partial [Haematococcus lacustris]